MNEQQKKIIGHTICIFFDLLLMGLFWFGLDDFNHKLSEIKNQAASINILIREGFFIVGLGAPLIHTLTVIWQFRPPNAKKKFEKIVNIGTVAIVVSLVAASTYASFWLKSQAKNAGYIYCKNASQGGVLSRVNVYTRNQDICEKLVESKRRH